MASRGWRALIYDCDWAYFPQGQLGLIISGDGKMCHTDSNGWPYVYVMCEDNVDEYGNPLPERRGHIMFIQNGTNNTQIICIIQKEGVPIKLIVDPATVCANYVDIKSLLSVTFKGDVLPPSKYELVSPSAEQWADRSQDTFPLIVSTMNGNKLIVSDTGVTITKVDGADPTTAYTASTFTYSINGGINCDDVNYDITCAVTSSNEVTFTAVNGACQITINTEGGFNIDCNGGTKKFFVERGDIEYTVTVEVTDFYDIMQCSDVIDSGNEPGEVGSWSVVAENGAILGSGNGEPVKFTCDSTVHSATINVTSKNSGFSDSRLLTF